MKVKRLPDSVNPNILQKQIMCESNKYCPFCGKKRKDILCYDTRVTYYGVGDKLKKYDHYSDLQANPDNMLGSIVNFIRKIFNKEPIRFYRAYIFVCDKCNGSWESDPHPIFGENELCGDMYDFSSYRETMSNIKYNIGTKKSLCNRCANNKKCYRNNKGIFACSEFDIDSEDD